MTLSHSMHGSSSLQTTNDKNKLETNFDNAQYGSQFEAYMSTNIGNSKMVNYDNFYINGVYSNMNVAKKNHHIVGKGKDAIFALCRGMEESDDTFDATRKIFGYLDEERENILNAKSLEGIKVNLEKFTNECNQRLIRDAEERKSKVSVLIVVCAFSGLVYMNSGTCSLLRIGSRKKCKVMTHHTDPMGVVYNHNYEIKKVNSFFKKNFILHTDVNVNLSDYVINGITAKENVISIIDRAYSLNPESDHTCMIVEEDNTTTITASTKITAIICVLVMVISIIGIFVSKTWM